MFLNFSPTFACIIAKQFHSLRHCDRFWYENAEPLTRFTTMQLAEIRKSSLAKLLCDNGDEIRSIQRSALDVPDQFLYVPIVFFEGACMHGYPTFGLFSPHAMNHMRPSARP